MGQIGDRAEDELRGEFQRLREETESGTGVPDFGRMLGVIDRELDADRRRRAYVTRWAGDNAVFHPHEGIQHMPPLPDIPAGGPLDSELWPVIWREDAGRSA